MKLRARFEKQTVNVGLSSEVPLQYIGHEQKYLLADWVSHNVGVRHIHYEAQSYELEFESTSDELVRTPNRMRCYRIISAMPESALPEVEEELRDTLAHYVELETSKQRPLLATERDVKATVNEQIKT